MKTSAWSVETRPDVPAGPLRSISSSGQRPLALSREVLGGCLAVGSSCLDHITVSRSVWHDRGEREGLGGHVCINWQPCPKSTSLKMRPSCHGWTMRTSPTTSRRSSPTSVALSRTRRSGSNATKIPIRPMWSWSRSMPVHHLNQTWRSRPSTGSMRSGWTTNPSTSSSGSASIWYELRLGKTPRLRRPSSARRGRRRHTCATQKQSQPSSRCRIVLCGSKPLGKSPTTSTSWSVRKGQHRRPLPTHESLRAPCRSWFDSLSNDVRRSSRWRHQRRS